MTLQALACWLCCNSETWLTTQWQAHTGSLHRTSKLFPGVKQQGDRQTLQQKQQTASADLVMLDARRSKLMSSRLRTVMGVHHCQEALSEL